MGNARAAFLDIYAAAYRETNVDNILDENKRNKAESRFTGDARNYTFEQSNQFESGPNSNIAVSNCLQVTCPSNFPLLTTGLRLCF